MFAFSAFCTEYGFEGNIAMAFDGIVISNVVSEMKSKLTDGRIYKIYQPENDELNIIIKNKKENYRLLMSADAGLPLIYIMNLTKDNPMQAPNFCMLLRKHIGNGRIVDICQPGFERIVEITIEHLDEMGDVCRKKLIIEIMGKHSNIIFTDNNNLILDSIKHVSHMVSSVREVLPGREYVYPPSADKRSPFDVDREYFMKTVMQKPVALCKAVYTSVTGFSPLISQELSYRAGLDGGISTAALTEEDKNRLYDEFRKLTEDIKAEKYVPNIVFDGMVPVEFSSFKLSMYQDKNIEYRENISDVLEEYYFRKSKISRIRQKSADLRKIVSNCIERTSKKYDIQLKQLKDTESRDKYKVYGELINTYGYGVEPGAKSFRALNYYTNEEIDIPLEENISVLDNSKKYFAKYNKLKRTYEALEKLTVETKEELEYLQSVRTFLDMTMDENSLAQVKEELTLCGYIKGRYGKKGDKKIIKSKPYHYMSSDGFDIYVGKNNLQNDELTFKLANGGDMWFHAKKMPGSHVIVRLSGAEELPDRTYEEAARLAAYYSSGRANPKVEVDYTERRNLKKPAGAKPGFVIYHTNYSMVAEPSITGIEEV
jgi:predicted ribosome quality control (RQC) complex YloA/Tae2 family protein